jgi:hypothetical protein
MSEMRELTDAELDAVCGGCHHHHHHPHHGGGSTLLKLDFSNSVFQNIFKSLNGVLQNNITVQIGVALFGGSVSQTSNSTNISII